MIHKTIIYLVFLSSLFAVSCKQELIGDNYETYAIVIEYDLEEKIYQDNSSILDTSLLTTSDIIASEVTEKNSHWKIQVKKDGTCRKEVIYNNKVIPPNALKQSIFDKNNVFKTVVYENNKAHYFNESGTLMYSLDTETPLEKELLAHYSKIKTSEKKQQLKNEILHSKHIEITEENYFDKDFGNISERMFYDTIAHVVIKRELYNSNNELFYKDSMSYQQYSPNQFIPYQEFSFSYLINEYNQKYIGIRKITYSNINIINNL
ncbi:MAG TPA: hypothetical protein PK734_02910 [Bacteroidales bacterium]|nr:MAG: hypothetical protein BWY22_02154 [Bacteroidetes bacterium ADurb.Bin217]HOS84108.1 hypothetical protein [Bacteroidales bacterium]HPM12424.1 hypothetical protein [Bacteroidales bacterium]